jgi:tetratricopeptide (TPR) repeat protein
MKLNNKRALIISSCLFVACLLGIFISIKYSEILRSFFYTIFPKQIITLCYFIKSGQLDIIKITGAFAGLFFGFISFVLLLLRSIKMIKIKRSILTIQFGICSFLIFVIIFIFTECACHVGSRIYFANGFILLQAGKRTEAIKYLDTAIKIDKNFSIAYVWLAEIYLNDNNILKVQKIFEKKATTNQDVETLMKVADVSKEAGFFDQAVKYYEIARKSKDVDNNEINLGIAETFIQQGFYKKAFHELSTLHNEPKAKYFAAKCYFALKETKDAYESIESAVTEDPSNFKFWLLRGKISASMKKRTDALYSLDRAIWLKKELPEAYLKKAEIFFEIKNYENCLANLKKAIYYDNKLSKAYVMAKTIENNLFFPTNAISENKLNLNVDQIVLHLAKGEKAFLNLEANVLGKGQDFEIDVLDPFGFGVVANFMGKKIIKLNSRAVIRETYEIVGMRDSSINLGKPWILNVVLFNINKGIYESQFIRVYVKDNEEGNIFFTVTEDLEETSDFPHKFDSTPLREDLDFKEAKIDLGLKVRLADNILNKYGIKWSHFIDIGSAFQRLRWIANKSSGNQWQRVWKEVLTNYKASLAEGNDIMFHIHSYSMPESTNFRQMYDAETDQLVFLPLYVYPDGHKGAWANHFKDLGNFKLPNSRIGSIYNGIKILEKEFCADEPNYRILVFRAGEYEFGNSKNEMRKSIISLRKNKILASSNAHEGRVGSSQFVFSKPIGENIYYTSYDDIHIKAKNLLDIGILEIIPIPKLYTMHYVRPVDDPKTVEVAYKALLDDKNRIKPGIHILMEMYHMFSVNHMGKWDSLDLQYSDWKKIDKHMQYISKNCKKIKFVTISDAVLAYYDYYSPDILALRTNEKKIDNKTYDYDVLLLGNDIKIDKENPHYCSIKPPSYFVGKINNIELIHNKRVLKKWYDIKDYEDLEFIVNHKNGYRLKVHLQ